MADTDAGQGVVVHIGGCRCPGDPRPHPDGDTVTLSAKLTIPMGAALSMVLNGSHPTLPSVQAGLTGGYLSPAPEGGILDWSFVDEAGKPVPVTAEAIERLIPWADGGMEVAEKADELYGADLLAPFLRRLSKSSTTGRKVVLTSANPSSGNVVTLSKRSSRRASAGKHSAARAR